MKNDHRQIDIRVRDRQITCTDLGVRRDRDRERLQRERIYQIERGREVDRYQERENESAKV